MRIIATIAIILSSATVWAAPGYTVGSYHCATQDNKITATWDVTAFNADLPYLDVTTNYGDGNGPMNVKGIGTVQTNNNETVIGIPNLEGDGFYEMEFPNDGSNRVVVGLMTCTLSN
jgi:hypothetical protein